MTTFYDEAERRKMRSLLVTHGTSADRAAEIVDLACHAAEQSVKTLHRLIEPGADAGLRLAATGLALELTQSQLGFQLERLVLLGQLFSFNAPSTKMEAAHG